MKAKSLLYAAVAAMACLSCTREVEESGVLDTGIELAFTAEWVNENGADSRTVLQDDGTNIWWMPGDEINLFFGDKASGRFRSNNSEPEAVVDFQGTLPVAIGSIETEMSDLAYWAVYPYSASNSCDGQSVTLSVSSSQIAKAGGFANKTFPAIAKSRSFGLAFYNVCGGVRFSLTQEGVKEVVFQGQNDEDIAGKVKVAFIDGVPAVQEITEGEKTITLTAPGNGSFETGKWYYITIIPGTLSDGFKMTFNTDTQYATLKASNAKTIKRGIFGSLADADEDLIYKDKGDEPEPDPEDAISFADPIAKYACVEKFDINGDGEVSYAEAAAATSLSGLFTDWNTVTLFDEIRFFTSVSSTQNVFTGLKNLKHITIPDNITTLGTFQNCTALDTVALPAALKALPASCFEGCSALESVKLPEVITAIPNYAFRNCSSLETLAIPSTITSIGQNAFTGCTILAGIDLPYGLKTIGNYAFERCEAISSLDFPSSLTSIGHSAYRGCGAITSISIGNGVSIGACAFSDCASLTTVVLPEDMTSISDGCFQNCAFLAHITWPAALTDIGAYAFYGCFISEDNSEASTIELPATVKTIGSQAFIGIRHLIMPSTSAISIASDSFVTGYTRLYVPSGMVEMYKVRTNWSAYKNQIYPIRDYPVTTPIPYSVPEAVDLGLPSGLKWASFNLGATKPEEYGDYFAWGETEPYYVMKNPLIWENGKSSGYSWSTYKWCMNGSSSQLTKYCNNTPSGYNGFTDNKTVLDPEDDAAAVALGGSWRMATYSEWDELKTKCTWTWTTQNGVNGRLVTGPNGNSIFLPAAGYRRGTDLRNVGSYGDYWSSSLYAGSPGTACDVYFDSDNVNWYNYNRYNGFSVRPVSE